MTWRLDLGWSHQRDVVSTGIDDYIPVWENLSQNVTSHSSQLSLAIPLWVGAMNTSQLAVTFCGWYSLCLVAALVKRVSYRSIL